MGGSSPSLKESMPGTQTRDMENVGETVGLEEWEGTRHMENYWID